MSSYPATAWIYGHDVIDPDALVIDPHVCDDARVLAPF
jgi:hypothetical protein